MTRRQMRHFEAARKEALKSDFHQRIGCVIVYHNHVLAKGRNGHKTHTEQEKYNSHRKFENNPNTIQAKIHAEIAALSKCRYLDIDWNKVEVYVWRETKDGKTCGMSAPCPACRAALQERGIRRLFYTGDDCLLYEYLIA